MRYFQGRDTELWGDPVASNPDRWDDGISSKRGTDQRGAQAQISINRKDSLLTAGFDWVDYEVEASWAPQETTFNNPAYFLLAKTRLFDRKLIITGGLRYDVYKLEVERPQGRQEKDHDLNPTVGLAYLLTDNLKLRANYGEAFVMPSADELAADFVVWGTRNLGNPDLKPEKSKTYEGGFDLYRNSLNISLTYFYTDYRVKIEATTTAAGDRTWENRGRATIEGLEGEVSHDLGELFEWDFQLTPYASFVYLTEYEDKETGVDLNYISDLQMSYGITLTGIYGMTANLNFAYTGKQRIEDWESGIRPVTVIEKGGFTVANLTIIRKMFNFREKGGLTLRGEIQNLLDKDYEYVNGYPMPGIGFFLGLRYEY